MNQPKRTYYDGLREGVYMYAWWKDGEQYVGTTGTTLHKALQEINELEARAIEKCILAEMLGLK